MIDVIEILTHWYTAPAVVTGMRPRGPPMDEQDWRRLATEWFPLMVEAFPTLIT